MADSFDGQYYTFEVYAFGDQCVRGEGLGRDNKNNRDPVPIPKTIDPANKRRERADAYAMYPKTPATSAKLVINNKIE